MKIAFSHDWLNGMRGGEKCLEALCQMYPNSPIHTLFYRKEKVSSLIAGHPVRTSMLQRFPGVNQVYRYYLPLFPSAVEGLNVGDADTIVSTSHCVAKGIRKRPGAYHLCYCFTPMRYAWGFFDEYFGKRNGLSRALINQQLRRIKEWDLKSNDRVDRFVAISDHVRKRIREFYGRPADVVFPPVDTEFFTADPSVSREDFYLVVSALVPYKRVDLAVRVFNQLKKRLVIIGDGPEANALKALAESHITFMGWRSDEVLRDHYRRAKALVFPGEEDFGIVPVEMQACGGAVIALQKGGALETVESGKTGLFFERSRESDLADAVIAFEKKSWGAGESRRNAERFSKLRFQNQMKTLIEQRP